MRILSAVRAYGIDRCVHLVGWGLDQLEVMRSGWHEKLSAYTSFILHWDGDAPFSWRRIRVLATAKDTGPGETSVIAFP